MRVLLTGAAGFIGQHVHRELDARGHEVRPFDSLRSDVHVGPPPAIPGLIIGDVRDHGAVKQALAGVDAVCHLAAKVGLGVDVQDLPDYADSNVYGTAVLLAAMAEAGVGRLALASSMVVYGEGQGRCPTHGPVTPGARSPADLEAARFEPPCPICGAYLEPALVGEDAGLDPRNAYAVTKASQEQLAAGWARAVGGSSVALRYHNVYGPGMPRDTPYAGVAAIFLSALRSGRAPQLYEDGGQRRDFVHVRDVAAGTVRALERHEAGVLNLNLGSGVVRTIGDLAGAMATAVGGPPPEVTGRFRLGDVRHITADSSRIRAELEWRPEVPFEDGIAELASEQ